MIPVSYYAPQEITSPKFAYAFAKGCGGCIEDDLTYLHTQPFAAFGSPPVWPLLRRAQDAGLDWWFADHGYFGRGLFYRITKNAYQHDGTGHADPERWAKFGKAIDPWRRRGSHVLVCPNSPEHFAQHGLEHDTWLKSTLATLKQHTDRDLRVRWKRGQRIRIIEDLRGAWACVVYSSAAALDALIAGIPVFVLAPFAAASRMGLSDLAQIEQPIYPDDREPFLWNLAAQQWTLSEIYRGQAWRSLTDGEASRAA